jgi:hypothetical protein
LIQQKIRDLVSWLRDIDLTKDKAISMDEEYLFTGVYTSSSNCREDRATEFDIDRGFAMRKSGDRRLFASSWSNNNIYRKRLN